MTRKERAALSLDRILRAALAEFSEKGFEGARMDVIASVASVNKQAPYHYFASKEALFQGVLQLAYGEFRGDYRELAARLDAMDVEEALWVFASTLFKPDQGARGFQQLLQDENRFQARHISEFNEAKRAYVEILGILRSVLDRGARDNRFRSGIDVTELYISIGGLFQFRTTNAFTLGAMLGTNISSTEGLSASRRSAFEFLLAALRP